MHPNVEVIIITGFGTIESAVEAMKMGASNYLLKPFTSSQLELAIAQIAQQRELRKQNSNLKKQLADESEFSSLLFISPEMALVQKLIKQVAPTDATVLIEGESGTGKEVIARALHENSQRKDKPYIKVNCAAVPENLLESEFFGHEKGAFTGATMKREGRFELANGGTLLLDEITEISLPLQAKLLRVLQEHEFERVGGTRTIKVNARIIATTNRDLVQAVADGKFREDLYYRLHVVPIKVPRLAERKGEVEFLLGKFLQQFATKHNKSSRASAPSRSTSSRATGGRARARAPQLRRARRHPRHPRRRALLFRHRAFAGRRWRSHPRRRRHVPHAERSGEAAHLPRAQENRRQPQRGRQPHRHQRAHPAQQAQGIPGRCRGEDAEIDEAKVAVGQ